MIKGIPLCTTKFLSMYNVGTEEKPYFCASRRSIDKLAVNNVDNDKADAVSCVVIVNDNGEDKLLVMEEYRPPIGKYILSIPAGLVDEGESIIETALREVKEETNLTPYEATIINELLYASAGMTDESNALVLVNVNLSSQSLSSENTVGGEKIKNYRLINREEAKEIILEPCYNMTTWMALSYFIQYEGVL